MIKKNTFLKFLLQYGQIVISSAGKGCVFKSGLPEDKQISSKKYKKSCYYYFFLILFLSLLGGLSTDNDLALLRGLIPSP